MVFVIVELKIEILWEHQLGSKDKKAEKFVRGAEGEQGVQFSWPPSTWLTRPLAGNAKVLQQINLAIPGQAAMMCPSARIFISIRSFPGKPLQHLS